MFDRLDLKFSDKDTVNLNLGFTRSWFQTPNSYDSQTASAPERLGGIIMPGSVPMAFWLAPADQRLADPKF